MNELGELLKNERLKKGISLDELQEITKIRTKYLKAIEDGDLNVIPALVYAKGFVKSYAEALGLDGDELLQKYGYLFQENDDNEIAITAQKGETSKKVDIDYSIFFKKLNKLVISVIILGVIGYGIYYFINQVNKGIAPLPNEKQQSQVLPDDKGKRTKPSKPDVKQQPEARTTIEKLSETAKSVEYKVTPSSGTFKVVISIPGQKCWFSVKVDGATAFEGLLTNGKIKSFDVKNSIEILMGFPPDVKITVDGIEIPHIDIQAPVTINLHT